MNAVVERPAREVEVAAPEGATTILQVIERAARDPNIDITKMERLLDMHESLVQRAAEVEFNKAMAACQAGMRQVATDAENPQTRSRYASYSALDKVLRPIYTSHGFSISYDEADSPKPEHIRVVAYVAHRAGFTRSYHTDMPADGKGAKGGDVMTKTHATGAAKSYGMRYLLRGIFNVAVGEDDTDGNETVVELLTAEQVTEIRKRLKAADAREGAFLAWAKVNRFEDIPRRDYLRCLGAISARKQP